MKRARRNAGALLVVVVAGLEACSSLNSTSLPSSPFFAPEQREAARYQALAREQDSLLATCAESHTCDRTHFTRALVALYENQAVAAKHFQDVMDIAPKSRLAASSQFWLHLLQNPPTFIGRASPFAEATERLVRDLLELETSSALVLQREVKARDKLMEDLTKQLDALKRIDQEMKEKSRPTRP
ncbi:MAG TPA: hypothetical protein VGQ07_00010 [Nitrospirales bacterium]|jgi:hypothetical protein|nr:hypothetical protein [Nitrospirales bacterium]